MSSSTRFLESRYVSNPLEIRSGKKTDTATVSGYPIVYNIPYDVRDFAGTYEEKMHPGIIDHLLGIEDIRLLLNHAGIAYARTSAGTLDIDTDSKGVLMRAELDLRRSDSNDLLCAIERGDVTQMSVGFVVAKNGDRWSDRDSKRDIYKLQSMPDVSIVTYPASPTTSVEAVRNNIVRAKRFVSLCEQEVRIGKPLSKDTLKHLGRAVGSLTAAGESVGQSHQHILDLLDKHGIDPNSLILGGSNASDQDGSVGSSTGTPPGGLTGDGAGSRSAVLEVIKLRAQSREDALRFEARMKKDIDRAKKSEKNVRQIKRELEDRTLNTYALWKEARKQYTEQQLQALFKNGQALKSPTDGHIAFPIKTVQDLKNAVSAAPLATHFSQADVKAHIVKHAKRLQRTDLLPDSWK